MQSNTLAPKWVIVNADDFARTAGVNAGIIEAHEQGIVTSASLMVRWPAAREAAAYARSHPALGVGLHLDLAEWVYRNDGWELAYEVVPSDDETRLTREVARQLDMFRDLMGREPTHIDSHQHVHLSEPLCSIVVAAAAGIAIPLRHCVAQVRYEGSFYGQSDQGDPYPDGISSDALMSILAAVPPGITEIACHPGYADDCDTTYRAERAQEVRTLCDPAVRTRIMSEAIQLRSFATMNDADAGAHTYQSQR